MTATANVNKTGNTVTGRFTLKNLPTIDTAEAKKPLFAFVGVADLALEQVKDASVKGLRGTVGTRVNEAGDRVNKGYTRLSRRGERLVTQIRRQPATESAIAEGKQAVRKAEASATAAKRSAKSGEKAVQGAGRKLG